MDRISTEDVPTSENEETSVYSGDIPSQNASDHQESMDISHSDGASTSREEHIQQLSKVAENIIEVEVDFNEKVGKKGANPDKTGIPQVLNAEFALRNTNGGIIKLKPKLTPENKKKINQWKSNLINKRDERLKILGQKENLAEIIDFNSEDLLIYVKKSSIILTDNSNLLVRNGSQKKRLQSYFEIQNLLVKNDKTRCCCTNGRTMKSFIQGQEISFGESTTVEYKELTSQNLPDKLRQELKDYVVQFANTCGGYVFFGISDAAIIKGQQVNEKEMCAIKHKVKLCMESKIWINKFGERETPERGTHYEVTFFPVKEADGHTFVIQVHICRYAGTVFLKEPKCKVVDDNNQIVEMSLERWLASFRKSVKTVKGSSDDYIDHLEAIKSNLTDGSNQLNDDLSQEENRIKYRRFLPHVAQHATTKWQEIGENLDVKHNKLESLKADYNSEGIEEQAYQMLVHWRQSDNKPTLEKLLVALIYTKLVEVANDVSGFLTDKRSRGGQKVEEKLLNKITNNVTDVWKFLGRYLGIDESTIHAIKKDHHGNTRLQARQMLFTWKQSNGSHATTGILINALHDVGKADVAREVQEWENKNSVILEDNLN